MTPLFKKIELKRARRYVAWMFATGFAFFLFFLAVPVSRAACYTSSTYSSWLFCRTITIDHTKVASSSAAFQYANFPVLVSVTTSTLRTTGNGGNVASSTGNDILFTKSDDSFQFNHEIEKYVSSTGELEAWVNVSSTLSTSSNSSFNMYYGNAAAANQQHATSTWDSNYAGVWHFANGTILNAGDSTSNANNGTLVNGVTATTTGQIDGAASLASASSQEINLGSGVSLSPTAITYSGWINASTFPNAYNAVISKVPTSTIYTQMLVKSSGKLAMYVGLSGSNQIDYDGTGSNTLVTSTWYHVAMTYDSVGGLKGYVNGSLDGSFAASGTLLTNATDTIIGEDNLNGGRFWNGRVDEVRVSNVARSADWLKTEYTNGNSPGTFESFGSETPGNGTFTVSPATIPAHHAGNILLTLTGTNTHWASSTTVFTLSGVASTTNVTSSITSATAALVTITTGNGTGNLLITETVSGSATSSITVATATLVVAPSSGVINTTPTLTLNSAQAVWTQESSSSLFSIAGVSGTSLAIPTISGDTTSTAVLTIGLATGTLTITDNSTNATTTFTINSAVVPSVQFSQATATIGEASSSITLGISLSATSSVTSTIGYQASGNATSGIDFTISPASVTISPGLTTSSITFAPLSDAVYGPTKIVTITLSNLVNATLGAQSTSTVTIVEGSSPPTIQFLAPTSSSALAATTTIPFTVLLSTSSSISAAVNYAATGGTAVNGIDYVLASSTATVSAGATSTSFNLTINNVASSSARTIVMTLSSPASSTLGTNTTYTYTITTSTVPGAPTAISATAGDGQATISFTAPTSTGGGPILFYTVTGVPTSTASSTGGSPITVTGLTNGTAYTFTVTATNAIGSSTPSLASNSVTPTVASVNTNPSPAIGVGGGGYYYSPPATPTIPTAPTTPAPATMSTAQLQTLLGQLQVQLLTLLKQAVSQGITIPNIGSPSPINPPVVGGGVTGGFKFLVDMKLSAVYPDVLQLQRYLNSHGFVVNATAGGPGSPGHETARFGYATRYQLQLFQKSIGLAPSGYCGPITRAYMNTHP